MTDPITPRGSGSTPYTSMSLLEMATMGNREAWEQIVYLYSPLVDRWCRGRSLREDDIQEIGQDVFLKLFVNLGKFRKDEPQYGFRKWLGTLTRNKVFDHLRRVRDEPRCVEGAMPKGSWTTIWSCLLDSTPAMRSTSAGRAAESRFVVVWSW